MTTTFYFSVIMLFVLLTTIAILIITVRKEKEEVNKYKSAKEIELKDIFKQRWLEEEQNFTLKKAELRVREKELESEVGRIEASLKEKEKRYEEINIDLENYRNDRRKDIDKEVFLYRQTEFKNANNKLLETSKDYEEKFLKEKEEKEEAIRKIKEELEDIRNKRTAINEEILRQRKLNDEEKFYRIQLDPNLKSDISLLKSIAPRLINPTAVNKLIWTAYYQKPLAELRKRLLPNGDISGIYKITRIATNEVYIGQAVSIDRRFQEHVKSALGVGNLASTTLHKLMAQDGPEEFLFEIIEEVSKDKLKEKEAFYIDFYDSKNYGMNTISGVKNGTERETKTNNKNK